MKTCALVSPPTSSHLQNHPHYYLLHQQLPLPQLTSDAHPSLLCSDHYICIWSNKLELEHTSWHSTFYTFWVWERFIHSSYFAMLLPQMKKQFWFFLFLQSKVCNGLLYSNSLSCPDSLSVNLQRSHLWVLDLPCQTWTVQCHMSWMLNNCMLLQFTKNEMDHKYPQLKWSSLLLSWMQTSKSKKMHVHKIC